MFIKKLEGEEVYVGIIIKNGNISIIVEKVGDDRIVLRIIKFVEDVNFNKVDI